MNFNKYTKIIREVLSHSFFKAAVWMFVGTGILSVGNYLYHLIMGRMLGPTQYGVLESIISFSYLLSVPLLTFNLIVVKYVSSYKGKKDYTSIASFYSYIRKRFLKEGIIFCLVLILLSPLITSFLHLTSPVYSILLVVFLFVGLFAGLNRGMLQGLSKFSKLAVINAIEATVKLGLAVLLVYLGFNVQGGLVGIIIATIGVYFIANFFIRETRVSKPKPFLDKHLVGKYFILVFFTMLSLTSLFTTDVLLARHFLVGELAGYYAALSVLGKVVFFAVSPICLVMFPFISEIHSRGEKYWRILLISLVLTALGAAFITLIYYLFPSTIVMLLFGNKYIAIAGYIGLFGVFISLYSVCYLLANFYLSIHKVVPAYFVGCAAILQILGIIIFHQDILQIIYVDLAVTFLLLISLLLYYLRVKNA